MGLSLNSQSEWVFLGGGQGKAEGKLLVDGWTTLFKNITPQKTYEGPKKGASSKGKSSSNQYFSGEMFVFRGVAK